MRQILLNDFQRQWKDMSVDVTNALHHVGSSGWYILGKEVEEFEKHLASFWGVSYCVGVASGLDAIEIGLRVLDLPSHSKVLTTPLTAFATTLAIIRAGHIPVFVDTDMRGQLDLDLVEEALLADDSIRALVPVHLFGHCSNLTRYKNFKEKFDIAIVEDCAQSVGCNWDSIPAGSVGHCAATSFYPTKNLGAMGDGGALLTNDESLANRAKHIRNYGQEAKYQHTKIGLNSRLDELQAAFLTKASLPRLGKWLDKRCNTAKKYLTDISNPNVSFIEPDRDCRSAWHLFPVKVDAAKREAFQAYLRKNGIASAIHYPSLASGQQAMSEIEKFEIMGNLSMAETISQEEVSLPLHPYLLSEEIERVIEACNAWEG